MASTYLTGLKHLIERSSLVRIKTGLQDVGEGKAITDHLNSFEVTAANSSIFYLPLTHLKEFNWCVH